jgi:hypothetical protein
VIFITRYDLQHDTYGVFDELGVYTNFCIGDDAFLGLVD